MGNLEDSSRKRRRRGYLQTAVLSAVGISSLMLVTMAAPNTLKILGTTSVGKRFVDQARSALYRLARDKCIIFCQRGGKRYVRITEKGKARLAFEQKKMEFSSHKKRRWDKRYRIVMFDIREERKAVRNRLRAVMQSWGFLRLQDSVWVYPHDCEEVISLLKADLKIGKEVLYVIAEEIENDAWVRDHFKLPHAS